MRFVVFGLSVSSAWGNLHATLWRGLCRALGHRGHLVQFFERDVPYYEAYRDLVEWPGLELHLYRSWDDVVDSAERALDGADVGMVTSFCPDGPAAAELVLASGARCRVFYDLDTPVTLDRLARNEPVPYLPRQGLSNFDLALSCTGGPALDALRERLGARRVAPLFGSVDPAVHQPLRARPPAAADLSYLGTYAEDRQAALDRLFLEPAQLAPHRRFLLSGTAYPPDYSWQANISSRYHVMPADHAAFYGSSRLTLNVTPRALRELGHCPSARLFEAAACAMPVICDWWRGLDEFFEPGRELLVVRNADDVLAALDLDDAELRRIGRNARERALACHTAGHRAQELIALVERGAPGAWEARPVIAPAPEPLEATGT